VNFGVFAGRDATSAEIEELARLLVPEVGEVSIISEERHEVAETTEIVLHQVRIEIPSERVPDDEGGRRGLEQRLISTAEFWARSCINERHSDISEL
jgi:hypothetical protein